MRPSDAKIPMWVTGRHPVEELLASALQAPRKVLLSDALPHDVRKSIETLSHGLKIPCVTLPKAEWERKTGEREGGGVAAEIASFRYVDPVDWVAALPKDASLFLLDGITDPQNFGAIIRSARAFGFAGVMIPQDRSCPVTPAVFRASAGAAAHVPILQVTNLPRAMGDLKEAGFWFYAAEGQGDTRLADWKPARRSGIVMGSEEKGVRRLVHDTCDGSVRIEMEPGMESLNVSVAAGILGHALRCALT
ncbi:MAG TPA: 23S rRNA (guanosine(2251)-2'-O)-methyltransferase RlmB [Candidatus Deferrimicrobiaceae bacterium]|jgi:23S rRNA (guanosine2251-2'-O)-methyltransferase